MCASFRAGISRPVAVSDLYTIDGTEPEVVSGMAIGTLLDGYFFIARWVRMLTLLFGNNLKNCSGSVLNRTLFILCIPETADRFLVSEGIDEEYLNQHFIPNLCTNLGISLGQLKYVYQFEGLGSPFHAVCTASEKLSEGQYDEVCIVSFDSFIEELSYEYFLEKKIAGFCLPGEAASAVYLSTKWSENAVLIENRVFADYNKDKSMGQQTASLFIELLENRNDVFDGDVYTDLIGDPISASDFGCSLVIVNNKHLASTINIVTPYSEFGYIGTATIGVFMSLASAALLKKYSKSDRIIILSQSSRVTVGAFLISTQA